MKKGFNKASNPSFAKDTEKAIIILFICFCAVFVGISIFFLNICRKHHIQEARTYVSEVAERSKSTIQKQITGDFQTLDGIAKLIGSMEKLDYELLLPALETINNANTFIRMGITDREGITMEVNVDGTVDRGIDLSKKGFLEKVYQGEFVLTASHKAEVGDFWVNYYAVPIEKNGVTISALCAVNKTDTFREIADASIFSGKGFIHIIDSNGNYMVRSQHPSVDQSALSIYESHKFTQQERTQLESDFSKGVAGSIAYSLNGEERFAAYTPIGINDWYVFCVVPEKEINHTYAKMSSGILNIIVSAILILLFFLIYIIYTNMQRRLRVEKIAFMDPLTGYRNEQKFLLDAADILRSHKGQPYAFLYSDIKNFKYINDIFGYDVGDALLRYWADYLNATMQEGEIFARLSTDHIVSLRKFKTLDDFKRLYYNAQQQLLAYPPIKKRNYNIELYLGIYLVDEAENNLSIRDMLNRANVAKKSAKDMGDCYLAYYTREMRDQYLQEKEIEACMETALENGEFHLYFQPQIDIQHGDRIMGVEALTRWVRPGKEPIPPSLFIPLFERNGFIVYLDRYIFEQSCQYYKRYTEKGGAPITIAVNVSRQGLMQPDFVETYTAIKNRYGIPDRCIELEFTETLIFEDYALFRSVIQQLRENGFICSLDDFGSGQSSLNILKNIFVDVLKIDMLFFRESQDKVRDWELIHAILNMAKALSMQTISEGVETQQQVDALRKMGCECVQGYVFAKPMPQESFEAFTQQWEQNHP